MSGGDSGDDGVRVTPLPEPPDASTAAEKRLARALQEGMARSWDERRARAWGFHYSGDFAGGHRGTLGSRNSIVRWCRATVDWVGMKAYGEPLLEHFGHADPRTSGWTLVQLIETSNLCGHFLENTGEYYIDLFSCREFDPDVVERACLAFFGGHCVDRRFLPRGGA